MGPMLLPIRIRPTVAFAAVMALLLAAGGAFLYARLGAELLRTTDAALRSQADVVAAGISQGGGNFGDQTGNATATVETFAQVLNPSGGIVESSETVAAAPLVGAAELAAIKGSTFLEGSVPRIKGTIRLLVVPTDESGGRLVGVVGSSLQGRHGVLSRVLLLLVIGGALRPPVGALARAALGRGALRPVGCMW